MASICCLLWKYVVLDSHCIRRSIGCIGDQDDIRFAEVLLKIRDRLCSGMKLSFRIAPRVLFEVVSDVEEGRDFIWIFADGPHPCGEVISINIRRVHAADDKYPCIWERRKDEKFFHQQDNPSADVKKLVEIRKLAEEMLRIHAADPSGTLHYAATRILKVLNQSKDPLEKCNKCRKHFPVDDLQPSPIGFYCHGCLEHLSRFFRSL